MLRLFLAIPISSEIKNQILRWQMSFAKHHISWTPDRNLHVTLLFLGNVRKENVESLTQELQKQIPESRSFLLEFEKFCVKNNAMIWAMFRENESFARLFKIASRAAQPFLGEKIQISQNQIPHVTLARGNHFSSLELRQISLPRIEIKQVELWQSELGAPHPKYSSIAQFSLKSQH